MKTIVSLSLLTFLAAVIILPLQERQASAQAPAGQQGGAPPQQAAPKSPTTPQQQAPQAGVSITVEVPVVTLDVIAATQRGDLLTGLKKENFKITDDGVAQTITNFGPTEAPITMVMLLEFSNDRWGGFFAHYAKYWSTYVFPNLKQQDWVALETFDLNTHLEVDFTQNKDEVLQGLSRLHFPGFSESAVFDAVLQTNDSLKDVKGKKSIVLLASGVDTFSKHNLDQTMKLLRQSDVTLFCVGLGQLYQNFLDVNRPGGIGSIQRLNYLQAENQLKTFAHETGGEAWFPQFEGEMPGIFQTVTSFLRHQYSLSYTPTSGGRDNKFHKVKIELVKPDGSPLEVLDQKGKKQKWVVYAREGYEAQKAVGAGGD
ncbi:MAG TPA: VWA domain-containing protein [Candidatus Acidoferrum sp.]|nr:VWA domain-containing protein [Candidatus Acidoferrum sp.]